MKPVICPYGACEVCEADWVDIGVDMAQCGPYVCPNCHASEVGPYDDNELDADETKTRWFKPHHIGTSANSFKGMHINAKTAKTLYRAGLEINEHKPK